MNERLDEILDKFFEVPYPDYNMGILPDEDGYDAVQERRNYEESYASDEARQALTSLIKELVAEAEADIKLWVDDEVIGSDERHSNGKKMVNYWSCEDCGTPEEAWTRNQLRADQRKRLWLEKFEQNLLKALEEV